MSNSALDELTMGSIMSRAVLVLPEGTAVAEAQAEALPGQILVLLGEKDHPSAILPEEQLIHMSPDRKLSSYAENLIPVAQTTRQAPVDKVWRGVWQNPRIRWHVVMDSGEVIGVVSPQALLRERLQRAVLDVDGTRITRSLVQDAGSWEGPWGTGGIGTDVSYCYRCDSGPSPHRVKPDDILHNAAGPVCPRHGTVTYLENPCGGNTD